MSIRESFENYSILIISGSEQYTSLIKSSLPEGRFLAIDQKKNASSGQRSVLERDYDFVVINTPLPDENGIELALDLASKNCFGVLVLTPVEIYEDVKEYLINEGVLVERKPTDKVHLMQMLRLLLGIQKKVRRAKTEVEEMRRKLEENRIVTRAKFILVEDRKMTEDEAHRYIGKLAMDHGISRRRVAEDIIESRDDF